VEEDQHLLQHVLTTSPPHHHERPAEDPEQWGESDEFDKDAREQAEGVSRGLEGAAGGIEILGDGLKTMVREKVEKDYPEVHVRLGRLATFCRRWLRPEPSQKSNFLLRWLHPEVYSDYTILRRRVPSDLPEPAYPEELERDIYYPPSSSAKPPTLWIPRDVGGISRQEVAHSEKVVPMTDEYVSIDEDGRMKINLEDVRLVFDTERLRY